MDLIRTIRTSPHTARRVQAHDDGQARRVRLVAKVLRELLQRESFENLSDLTEALKCRCAPLKIRDYSRLVHLACDLVASNRPLVQSVPARVVCSAPEPRPLSRREAATLWGELVRRCPTAIKTLPATTSVIRIDATRTDDVVDIESLVTGGRA